MRTLVVMALMAYFVHGSFSVMRASQIREGAKVFVAGEACPIKWDEKGACIVKGDVTEDFLSGDTQITSEDGSVLFVPSGQVRGVAWSSDNVRYEAFPLLPAVLLAALGAIGFAVFILSSRRRGRRH